MGFETVEAGRNICAAIKDCDPAGSYLLDSVTALLQNEIFPPEKNYALDLPAADRCARELLEFVRSVRSAVLVSDYIFSDAEMYDPMTEQSRRALAGIDRMLARECDTVVYRQSHARSAQIAPVSSPTTGRNRSILSRAFSSHTRQKHGIAQNMLRHMARACRYLFKTGAP